MILLSSDTMPKYVCQRKVLGLWFEFGKPLPSKEVATSMLKWQRDHKYRILKIVVCSGVATYFCQKKVLGFWVTLRRTLNKDFALSIVGWRREDHLDL